MKCDKIYKCGVRYVLQCKKHGDFVAHDGTYGSLMDAYFYKTEESAKRHADKTVRVASVEETIYLVSA